MCLNEDEEETTDSQNILDELKSLYSGLYKKRFTKTEQECIQYLSDINTPNLSEEKQKQCEGKLTLKEIRDSLVSVKNGKSPGNDGLTKKFYIAFFGERGRLMFRTFNHSFQKEN